MPVSLLRYFLFWYFLLCLNSRWPDGPVVNCVPPILVNFSTLEDKSLVLNSLKEGCKTPKVYVTTDSKSRRENAGITLMKRKRKKSDYHAHCFLPTDPFSQDDACSGSHSKCTDQEEEDFDK